MRLYEQIPLNNRCWNVTQLLVNSVRYEIDRVAAHIRIDAMYGE